MSAHLCIDRRCPVRFFLIAFLATGLVNGCQKDPAANPGAKASDHLVLAKKSLTEGNYAEVLRRVKEIPAEPVSDWLAGQFLAAEAATRQKDYVQAALIYQTIAERTPDPATKANAFFFEAEVQRESGRLADAIRCYREAFALAPENVTSCGRLAFLLGITGDSWSAVPFYVRLIKSGAAKTDELVLFADRGRPVEQLPYLKTCEQAAPADLAVRRGIAAHSFWEGKREEAEKQLKDVIQQQADDFSAQAMLGELLVAKNSEEFEAWHQSLPKGADDHSDIWYVRGLWARRVQALRASAGYFLRAIQLDGLHRKATYQLGQVLVALNHPAAQTVSDRALELNRLTAGLDQVLRHRQDQSYKAVAESLIRLGRIWEACAWGVEARNLFPEARWPSQLFTQYAHLLTPELPLVARDQDLAKRSDLKFDIKDFDQFLAGPAALPSSSGNRSSKIRFAAAPINPEFRYYNGADEATIGARTFEVNGGGVAVLDYDLDGLPDLFFSQGQIWKTGEETPEFSTQYQDRLYRNQDGSKTVDVTSVALPTDPGFGQGCTVGDFDNDGFVDLYVADVGRNQLLRNLGDGTFEDVTDSAGITAEEWTASVLMADLNADGNPDLFDVNYLQGPNIYTAICNNKSCSPLNFDGTPSRLLISQGDGTFRPIANATPQKEAKGLGIVLVPSDDLRRPSLFIANDQVANFLLHNAPAENAAGMTLTNEAFAAGVAFNQDGLAMAGMGVAADDINADGLVDLYVSNFKDESNTLFVQDSPGLFLDATSQSGLKSASIPYVGWGTQFFDADLDGWSDLVLVNGHVDDLRPEGGEYHMRPQFFKNVGQGRFEELFGDEVGEFFNLLWLGRGLARLDFNRDGLMDFVVNPMDQPAQLVLNETQGQGHHISFKLHATETARDAIGTKITITTPAATLTKFLLAGDGYMASNERVVQFGLGNAEEVTSVDVYWPSGSVTTLKNPPVDVTLELVEKERLGALWRARTPTSWQLPVDSEQATNQ